jgi:hypothetical protein
MNRHPDRAKPGRQTIRVWTYPQIQGTLPYIASVLRSLRESRLEAGRWHLKARRLADRPGRPDRTALLAREEALHEARLADDRFQEALEELHALDVYCLDPVRGLALVPFVQDKQLAWFVYDLFDPEPLRSWRYHHDALDTRRPIAEALEGPAENDLVV